MVDQSVGRSVGRYDINTVDVLLSAAQCEGEGRGGEGVEGNYKERRQRMGGGRRETFTVVLYGAVDRVVGRSM